MSNAAPNNPVPESIARAAAAWVLRHDRGLTAAEQDEFLQWLASDPRHGEQWARHCRHWDRLETLARWRPEHSTLPNPDLLAPPLGRWVRFWPAATLAAAAAVALIFAVNKSPDASRAPDRSVAAASAVTPVTQRTLEDGTVVELNRGAVLEVQFTAGERRVILEQGEAHSTVTKTPARPFVVAARGMDVVAVGTAFNVRLDRAVVEVLVTEGRVQVTEAPSLATAGVATLPRDAVVVPVLEAGQRAVVSLAPHAEAPKIATLTSGEIERVLAWQHRMLDFTAAPLAEVVAEFNRRNAVQLVIVDPALAAMTISASFRSDNVDGFVRLVEVGFGVRAQRSSAGEIRLHQNR